MLLRGFLARSMNERILKSLTEVIVDIFAKVLRFETWLLDLLQHRLNDLLVVHDLHVGSFYLRAQLVFFLQSV